MIGIIGAMEEEVAALKSEMADAKVTEFASMTFYKGTLCGKDTVVVRSGIGKVNGYTHIPGRSASGRACSEGK